MFHFKHPPAYPFLNANPDPDPNPKHNHKHNYNFNYNYNYNYTAALPAHGTSPCKQNFSGRFISLWLPAALFFLVLLFTGRLQAQPGSAGKALKSPDGQVSMELSSGNAHGKQLLQYTIHYKGEPLATGSIGFVLGKVHYGAGVTSINLVSSRKNQHRTLRTRGNHEEAAIHKNEYRFEITSDNGSHDFFLSVNLYNNGIAYRFEVDHGGQDLTQSNSKITLLGNPTLWWQTDIHTYEANYHSAVFNDLADSVRLGMPLTIQYPTGVYAALTEADIFGFAGSSFSHYKGENTLNYTLAGPVHSATAHTGFSSILQSGWEIMTIAKDLNELVNNDILRDVSPAPDKNLYPDGAHTAWIQPGKSIWTWMSKKRDVTPENIRRFTDDAAAMQIPYNLIDDGWVKWQAPGKDHWQLLKEQVDYAKSKGVGIWVWQAYPPHNGTPGLIDTAYLRTFMKNCAALGVKGMKIDFIDAETQEKIDFYKRAALIAAQYHLMVDFHGANKGTGMEYTYPNILSQEGVRGLEQQDNQHWPYLNTVLPFTRYLSGPADYTPVSFAPYVSSTTLAHQVATAAIFTSPFLCLGADPGDLSQSIALPFIQQIPATWDQTIVLKSSKIGAVAAFARKKGHNWYLAVLNGDAPRTLTIDLSFLGRHKYKLSALENDLNSNETKAVQINKVKKSSPLQVRLPAGGGYFGIFKR